MIVLGKAEAALGRVAAVELNFAVVVVADVAAAVVAVQLVFDFPSAIEFLVCLGSSAVVDFASCWDDSETFAAEPSLNYFDFLASCWD